MHWPREDERTENEKAISSTIKFTEQEWAVIYNKIADRYKDNPSVLLIRNKMKRTLGFTVRRHREYVPKMSGGYYDYEEHIHLDFYDEGAMTLFRLTYI